MGYYNRSYFTPAGGYNTRFARSTGPKKAATMTYTAEMAWGAAVAALRINEGEYVKYDVRDPNDYNIIVKHTNKSIVRGLLTVNPELITAEDRAQGLEFRAHFQGLLFRQISGEINDFLQTAMRVAGRDEFTDVDHLDLAILASLPKSAERDIARQNQKTERRELSRDSQHIGVVGDKFGGEVEVLNCFYSQKWATYYVNAKAGANLLMFAFRNELARGTTVKIQGTVKAHREDGITQLNRVKVVA